MAALLAVPVGVLLFVVVLALMSGRWTAPAPLAETDPDLGLDLGLDLELGLRPDPGPAPYPGPADRPGWQREAPLPPAVPERALPPAPARAALPPARPRYGAYSHPPYTPSPENDASSQQAFPYGPYRHQ